MNNLKQHIPLAIKAALDAGKEILDVYHNEDFDVDFKSDDSPLTKADLRAHQCIVRYLEPLQIPILSEEGVHDAFETRANWTDLWVVDPLDGTKEFIKRNGEFTVNIAYIKNNSPQFGIIYVPVKDTLYFGGKSIGSFKMKNCLNTEFATFDELLEKSADLRKGSYPEKHTIVASRSHLSPETEAFFKEREKEYGEIETVSMGSSLKICLVAENKAHVYPRYAPTMEWDTAAGHAIAQGSGKELLDYKTKAPMKYNREQLRNNWFIVE